MTDLTTAAAVQNFLSLPAGQDAALLANLVTSASQLMLNQLNRQLLTGSLVETRNGNDNPVMAFREYPVTAVSSLLLDNVPILPATPTGQSGYVFSDKMLYLRGGDVFRKDFQNVVISYTAGFAVVPTDLAQACIEIVATKYKRRGDLHINTKILDGQTITYNTSDIIPSARLVLNNYMKVFQT